MVAQLVVWVLASQTPAAPLQPDVEIVARLHQAVRAQVSGDDDAEAVLRRDFSAALEDVCRRYAVERGLPPPGGEHAASLHRAVIAFTNQRLKPALAAGSKERTAALLALARELTSTATAERVVSDWMGLPPPPTRAPTSPERAQIAQSEAGKASVGDLVLVPESTRVVEEVGGPGAQNGVVDAGEWVRLEVALKNTGALPWFSTTASVQPQGSCAWSDPEDVQTVGELGPGEEGGMPIWIYVSSTCPSGDRPSLLLTLRDRHRKERAHNVVELVLSPMTIGAPRIARAEFDASDLESGGENDLTEVGPGMTFEYVTDLAFPRGDIHRVSVTYAFPTELEGLFTSRTLREVEMVRTAPGEFVAGDDLDATTVPLVEFRRVLERTQKSRAWVATGRRGQLPVAVDVRASVVPALPQARAVLEPWLGLDLTPNGTEVAFDEEGFSRAYEAIALKRAPKHEQPPPPKAAPIEYSYRLYTAIPVVAYLPSEPAPRIAEAAPEPATATPAVATRPAPAPTPAAATQVPVALQPVAQATTPAAVAPRLEPTAQLHAVPANARSRRSWLRLDFGAGASLYQVAPPPGRDTLWGGSSSLALPVLSTKLFVGPHVSAVLAASAGMAVFEPVAGRGTVTVPELGLGAGAGYLIQLWRFEATPYALFDFRYREVSEVGYSTSTAVTGGATLRYQLSDRWRAVLDATWTVGPGAPNIDNTDLISGGGPRLILGFGLKL